MRGRSRSCGRSTTPGREVAQLTCTRLGVEFATAGDGRTGGLIRLRRGGAAGEGLGRDGHRGCGLGWEPTGQQGVSAADGSERFDVLSVNAR